MSAGLVGPSLPPGDAGEELRGPSAGVWSLLRDPGCAGGQLPTRWHCWSRVALPGRAILAATWGCFWGLSSTPMGWAGPGSPQGETQPALLGTSPRAVQQQESSGCPAGMISNEGYVSSSRPRGRPSGGLGTLGCHHRHLVFTVAEAASGTASPHAGPRVQEVAAEP